MRQPRVPIAVSLLHSDWVRTQRAAGIRGMTLSEYGRAVLLKANEEVLGPVALPPADPGPQDAAA